LVPALQKRNAGLSEAIGSLWLSRFRSPRPKGHHDGGHRGSHSVCPRSRSPLPVGDRVAASHAGARRNFGFTHHISLRPPRNPPLQSNRLRIHQRHRSPPKTPPRSVKHRFCCCLYVVIPNQAASFADWREGSAFAIVSMLSFRTTLFGGGILLLFAERAMWARRRRL